MTPDMELRDVVVRYGGRRVLEGLSLSVTKGSVFALLGRNGSGKSTAIRCALGLERPNAGEARLFGEDAWRRRDRAMARVGVVPEDGDAPPELTPAALIAFQSKLYPRFDAVAASRRLRRFGVGLDAPFGALSRGQKKQVGLALALATRAELLVLDDPTLGLDAVARDDVLHELIGEIADRPLTILLTTHDIGAIEGLATHVGVLKDGKLAVNDAVDAVKRRHRRVIARGEPAEVRDVMRDLGALRIDAGPWGTEAILGGVDEHVVARLRGAGRDLEIAPMSLAQIFAAVGGDASTSEVRT